MQEKQSDEVSISRILISGVGFLADAYDLFVINVAVDLMAKCDYQEPMTSGIRMNIKAMAVAGAILGQLLFGSVADLIGRKRVFIVTCFLVIVGALLSATVANNSNIYTQLCVWRFVLGIGVGGEYPLSASITSESSTSKNQIRNLALVFSMQGLGALLCAIVLYILTHTMGDNYNAQWRIALALGGFPMACAFYFRWKMHETSWQEEAKALHVIRVNQHEIEDVPPQEITVSKYFSDGFIIIKDNIRDNFWRLLGTAGAWFILDIVFYANGLFSGQVTSAMNFAKNPKGETKATLILQCISLPGYYFSVLFAESIGLRNLQHIGFIATAFFFVLLAIFAPYLVNYPGWYMALYGLTFFFQNFGANTTTYIIPSIIYTSAEKATCHGISAAFGKLGALLGTETFLYMAYAYCDNDYCGKHAPKSQVHKGLQLTFAICAALAVIGLIWSYFLVDETPAGSLLIQDKELELTTRTSKEGSEKIDILVKTNEQEEVEV